MSEGIIDSQEIVQSPRSDIQAAAQIFSRYVRIKLLKDRVEDLLYEKYKAKRKDEIIDEVLFEAISDVTRMIFHYIRLDEDDIQLDELSSVPNIIYITQQTVKKIEPLFTKYRYTEQIEEDRKCITYSILRGLMQSYFEKELKEHSDVSSECIASFIYNLINNYEKLTDYLSVKLMVKACAAAYHLVTNEVIKSQKVPTCLAPFQVEYNVGLIVAELESKFRKNTVNGCDVSSQFLKTSFSLIYSDVFYRDEELVPKAKNVVPGFIQKTSDHEFYLDKITEALAAVELSDKEIENVLTEVEKTSSMTLSKEQDKLKLLSKALETFNSTPSGGISSKLHDAAENGRKFVSKPRLRQYYKLQRFCPYSPCYNGITMMG